MLPLSYVVSVSLPQKLKEVFRIGKDQWETPSALVTWDTLYNISAT